MKSAFQGRTGRPTRTLLETTRRPTGAAARAPSSGAAEQAERRPALQPTFAGAPRRERGEPARGRIPGACGLPRLTAAAPTPRAVPRPPPPRRPPPLRGAVLTSPTGSRGPSDAMARGSEEARPGRPAAAPSAGGTDARRSCSPLFRLRSGRQEVRHRNAPRPAPRPPTSGRKGARQRSCPAYRRPCPAYRRQPSPRKRRRSAPGCGVAGSTRSGGHGPQAQEARRTWCSQLPGAGALGSKHERVPSSCCEERCGWAGAAQGGSAGARAGS